MSGTGLNFGAPQTSRTVEAMGLDAIEAGPGEVLSAAAGSAWAGSIGPRIVDFFARNQVTEAEAEAAGWDPSRLPVADPADLNRQYGIPGVLKFDAPMTERAAAALHDSRVAEMKRQAVIERRGDGLATSAAARLGVGFATAVLDPVNVAAAFIPVVGPARTSALLARAAGPMERAAIRAGVGAAEGAAGMAALEPLNYGLSRSELNDWTMAEALHNVAFGGILGGGLHVAGGAIADRVTGRYRNPLVAALEAAGPDARESMLRGAVAAVAEDRPVAVQAVLDLPTVPSYRPVASAATDGNYAAFTPSGIRVEARPEVVDLGSLIPSHTADGAVNPLYPHAEGLQPRDRGSAGSQDQVQAIAANLQPERLAPSAEAGAGAPIVDARGVVESGNGRLAALERVYTDPALAHRAAAYRAFLEAQGHDLTGIARPVLVGRRVSEMTADEARAFARGANERPNLSMTAAEQARADAERAGRAIDQLQPGALTSGANRDFVRAFMAQLPAEERGALILRDGSLSAAGELRIRQAMLAHAYGDALGPALERMLNGDVDNMKAVAGALADVAGPWGQMRRAAAAGAIPADLDITAAIGEAVQLLERSRSTGRPLAEMLAQGDAFAAPPSAAVQAVLRLLHRDDAMARPLGREPLADMLGRYVDQAMQARPGPDMFGAAPPSAADILRAVARRADASEQTMLALRDLQATPMARAEEVQASRAAQEAAQADGAVPANAGSEARGANNGVATPVAKEAQAAAQQADAAIAELSRLDLSETERAQLASLREGTAAAEAEARATEAAALCMVGVR